MISTSLLTENLLTRSEQALKMSDSTLQNANQLKLSGSEKDSFSDFLKTEFSKVNDLQIQAEQSIQKMVVEPSNIDLHQVTTALTKAELSLFLAKSVTERVIRAYNDMINLR